MRSYHMQKEIIKHIIYMPDTVHIIPNSNKIPPCVIHVQYKGPTLLPSREHPIKFILHWRWLERVNFWRKIIVWHSKCDMQHYCIELICSTELYWVVESIVIVKIWWWHCHLESVKILIKWSEIVVDFVAHVYEWTDIFVSNIVIKEHATKMFMACISRQWAGI